MSSSYQLNLVNVGWPICLLLYQQRLSHLAPGEVLKVRVKDPEVAASIRRLARRQKDRVFRQRQEDGYIRMYIRRHAPAKITDHPTQ